MGLDQTCSLVPLASYKQSKKTLSQMLFELPKSKDRGSVYILNSGHTQVSLSRLWFEGKVVVSVRRGVLPS